MTIILFLIDTSASMSQRAHVNGTQKSYLDIAKGAVETFLKYRQRSQDCMGDRYMLLTFEDPPGNVKAGWKENHATFMNELKNLQSNGLTSMGEALKNAFDLLNLNRMVSGIDTYGQGRCPFYLEPSVIIVITDGGRYSHRNGIHQDIILPLHAQIPGAKLTKEPFRWDQRLFSLVLRMPGNRMEERVEGKVPHDDSPIEKMCEVTGGRSYKIRSHYVLNQCIESLVQKVQPGVVVHFDQLVAKEMKDGEVQDLAFQPTKKMIYVQKHPTQKAFPVGYWPIPEPYWPDPKSTSLPPRDAHPKIRIISPCVEEPRVVSNFPIDKYELEACPLTLQILSKKEPNRMWPLLVSNQNGMHGNEMPFGYLKANSTNTVVQMYVLPYDFPKLLPLINDFFQRFNCNPPTEWIYKFTNYVKSIPQYYCPFLRRAMVQATIPFNLLNYILPENLDIYLSPAVANYLKQMKNTAKQDQENLCLRVFKQLKMPKPPYHQIETAKLNCGMPLKRDLVTHPMLKETFSKMHQEINIIENYSITVPTLMNSVATKNYRNPFDIPRKDLIDEIVRMRENFFKIPTVGINLYTKDAGHCLPIAEMGNYQEYTKNKEPPLRELEPTNVRQHMFGNPYKKDKNMVMVDEADLGEIPPRPASGQSPMAPQKLNPKLKRRRAGPIRKDYIYKRQRSEGSSDSLMCYQSQSDTEDEASETGSVMSEEASPSEVSSDGMSFDMEESMEEFQSPMANGHVQNFINGFDTDEPETPPPRPLEPSTPPPPVIFVPAPPPPVPAPPIAAPASLPTHNGPLIAAPDTAAQEISKILQMSCATNGNSLDESTTANESDAENAPPNLEHAIPMANNLVAALAAVAEEAEMHENVKKDNLEVRSIIFKDIRRPGRNYATLIEHLSLIKGNFETKFNFIKMCINESLRFRRRKMADSIQEWWETQVDQLSANAS